MNSTSARPKKKSPAKIPGRRTAFRIVAIGASAGGLEAFTELLKNLPANTGMSFIYVQHLSPNHKSMLSSLLTKVTSMKVQEATNEMRLEPNTLYVIPPDKELRVSKRRITLAPRPSSPKFNLPIDILFSSLAEAHKECVIGIILSGNANDGTKGMKSIKHYGGITFAQDESAKFNSMPKSAIADSAVDYVLSPKEIAQELIRLSRIPLAKTNGTTHNSEAAILNCNPELKLILQHLHKASGVDFHAYKMQTIKRRIMRRMLLYKLKSLKEYAKLLEEKKDEADILYQDLLINVTSFFRDTDTYKYLKTTLLPKLLKNHKVGEPLRIWVPACSTGEEVYSIAMMLIEIQDSKSSNIPIQIFGTDLSAKAIRKARIGLYSKTELEAVSTRRIQRFFTKNDAGYRIVKSARDMCVLAQHNILLDPPFSRLDFISCRNLFIYLDTPAQQHALATFHFALQEDGYLLLGKSESINTTPQLFIEVHNRHKIFSRKTDSSVRALPHVSARRLPGDPQQKNPAYDTNDFPISKIISPQADRNLDTAIEALLDSKFMPASVVINREMEILQYRGSTDLYFIHSTDKSTLNILKVVRPEIALDLRNAISEAINTRNRILKSGIKMKLKASIRMISLEVVPLHIARDEPLLFILFSEQASLEIIPSLMSNGTPRLTSRDRSTKKLEDDLTAAHALMHSYMQAQEVITEELQSANEEVVSSNEELATVNEELITSKEELESTNEQLANTNEVLQTRNKLLNESYEYGEAILSTIHEPLIILNKDLRIKSANKSFYKKFGVRESETEGVLLYDLGNKQWNIPALRELLEKIIPKNSLIHNFEITHDFPGIGNKIMLLNANRIIQQTHREQLILLAIHDVTEVRLKSIALQLKEKELLKKELNKRKSEKEKLEKAVEERTTQIKKANKELVFQNREKEKRAAELFIANKELVFQNREKEKRAAELIIANKELVYQNKEKEKRAAELIIANKELLIQNTEKEKRAAEFVIANKELLIQNTEKEKRAAEFVIANKELLIQNTEKEKRAAEFIIANKELLIQNSEKEKRAAEFIIANKELVFQNTEKEKRAAELIIANKELVFQNTEKEKRAAELIIANKELVFQNTEKEKRAAELIIANKELVFQNTEKEKRAAELIIANKELVFQNTEKEKRAAELIIANKELVFQNTEKEKRAAELIIANEELVFQNEEKEKRAAELIIANEELVFQNTEKEKRAAELIIANEELVFQNAEKEKRAAELIIVNKELEAFTYVSSHDLQEPLRKIQTFAKRISEIESRNLSDKGKDYFLRMQVAANRMQTLIEDLLAFSRINTAERKFENTDLNIIIDAVKTELKDTIEEKHAVIQVTDLCPADIIVFQFKQLIQNLISNALKFSKPNQPPQIVIKCRTAKGIALNNKTLSPQQNYCHVSISDNGIGFEPEFRERIFEVFQKLHGKDEYAGTGIGLAIVKKIVDNHQGIITATSQLNEGATFDIYIPSQ